MVKRNLAIRSIITRLRKDGWVVARKGPGDHVQFKHPTKTGRVTVDMGRREIPLGTLRKHLPAGRLDVVNREAVSDHARGRQCEGC